MPNMEQKNSQLNQFLKKANSNVVLNEKFQEKLFAWFENKGLLSELRAYMRQKMITALKESTFGVSSISQKNSKSVSPKMQAMNLLIAEFLLQQQNLYTLSVFVTEVPFLSNIPEFSTYVSKIADKNFEDVIGIEAPPRFQKKDVEDVLQALGLPQGSHLNIRTRRMYQFNREDQSLLKCLIECLQTSGHLIHVQHGSNQEEYDEDSENELWTPEIRELFINSDLDLVHLEILQQHITRYHKNAIRKLKNTQEAKYRLKVSEVQEKEKEMCEKSAEAEKRLVEQQETIQREIANREEQLITLSSDLWKQHNAIAERLLQLQERSQEVGEKERLLKTETEAEKQKLEAKERELEVKKKELEEAYEKLSEEREKISDKKRSLEASQKILERSNLLDSNESNNNVKFLQYLSHQCSILSQKLANIRSDCEKVETRTTGSMFLEQSEKFNLPENYVMFEQHKELLNETKAILEEKINELILKLEETKEKHLSAKVTVQNDQVIESNCDKKLVNQNNGIYTENFVDQKSLPNVNSEVVDETKMLYFQLPSTSKNDALTCESNSIQATVQMDAFDSPLCAPRKENHEVKCETVDLSLANPALLFKLEVERHLVKKLQEENAELRTRSLLQNQQLVNLTFQTKNLEARLNSGSNTVRLLTADSTDVAEPLVSETTPGATYTLPPVIPSTTPTITTSPRPRRQWFSRHVGSGEESTFASLNTSLTPARLRFRETRKKPLRRTTAPSITHTSPSNETSSGVDNSEKNERRLQKLERDTSNINRLYQEYQYRRDQSPLVVCQQIQTCSTNTQPIYNCAETITNQSSLTSSNFQPYSPYRPICSMLKPIITSVPRYSSHFSENIVQNGSPNRNNFDTKDRFSRNSCSALKKMSNKNISSKNTEECECFGEKSGVYFKYEQYPNRKLRHYYRHWFNSHLRNPSYTTSPTDTDTSRSPPLKQLFHLKQYKYKKTQATQYKIAKNSMLDTEEIKSRKNSKSLKYFHAGRNDFHEEDPHFTNFEKKLEIKSNSEDKKKSDKNEALASSSDDSAKFEKLLVKSQNNVTALKKKFANFNILPEEIKSGDSYILEDKLSISKENQVLNKKSSQKASDGKAAEELFNFNGKKMNSNQNIDVNQTEHHNNQKLIDNKSRPKELKVVPDNSSSVISNGHDSNLSLLEVDFNHNEQKKLTDQSNEKISSAHENIVVPNSKLNSSVTDFELITALKIKENYRKLSLYNKLNDYYEEIINEMNASEEEKHNISDIDCVLNQNGEKADSFEELIKEPIQGISELESSLDSSEQIFSPLINNQKSFSDFGE